MKLCCRFILRLFSSLRPLNLFLIFLTQTLTSVFLLDNKLCYSNLFSKNYFFSCRPFYFLVLATVLSAAGGYILNNIYDRKIDLINAAERSFFTTRNLSLLYVLSSLFFWIALILGFLISLKIGLCILLSIYLLIFYARKSKKIGILKPIIVSFLTAFSIFLVGLSDYFSSVALEICFFSVWAFLLSMLREIIKDFEDFEGDFSQASFTSVIQLGKKNSFVFLYCISIILIFSILISVFVVENTLYNSLHKTLMIILISLFIFLLTNKKFKSSNNVYKKLSLFCKIMMLVGILGMMVY